MSDEEDDLADGGLDGAPVYLVRWPNLSACLVRAHDEHHLKHMLDELADPGSCKWQIYDGPIWVEFDLPVTVGHRDANSESPASRTDLQLDHVEALLKDDYELTPSIPGCDTGGEMHDAILGAAFPATHARLRVWQRGQDDFDDSAPMQATDDVLEDLRGALLDDLKLYLETGWRIQQVKRRAAKGDVSAALMAQMGLTEDIYDSEPDE